MKAETQSILTLVNKPYDEYNAILPLIKQKLGYDRVALFETALTEELPLTTARRAYRAAIMVAMGEDKVYREVAHQRIEKKRTPKKGFKKEAAQ